MDTTSHLHLTSKQLYFTLKRFVEPVIALGLLILLAPLMIAIVLLIRLDSPGPAIFVQMRIGKDGRPFRILKFRTMHNNRHEHEHVKLMRAFVRGEIDPRQVGGNGFKPHLGSDLTRIGEFLRKTSLDELPQLVNVIKGDMSLVGPRPNVPWEVEEYKEWHMERLKVLPGITGLAQVNGRSGIDFDAIARHDIEYVQNQSFVLDLQIIWKTFATVVKQIGVE